ncbi:serine/threonine-protein kinase [Streptomyces lunaelactis]|uniref:serine/threonine-protein kinase n=1 Tax=Streptomyces lunaelactis TaxID=1535768 RepID=UPI0015851024|nr:serine/threonine-protein kinase [Streptomyces lunaelactis]NUK20150.1 serine/threonine protein kinase [Streptomyces lunaelactis]
MGTILADRYRLLELLGSGGMGDVWRALDERLGRLVAVKVSTVANGSGDHLALRLHREARAAARLNHPHIVTVHDHGEAVVDGRPVAYLVMELVDGQPLHHAVADRVPPLADVLDWAEQICRGLQAAHAAGVIHRDIKPGNILLTAPHGQIKICDFGIAQAAEHTRTLTATGTAIGTPTYMSPEQIRGAKEIDARSDLYSLGCLLYELLAGVPPFTGTGWSLLAQHLDRQPEPVVIHRGDVPAELECLVGELLSKRPQDRPGTAAAVAERLRAVRTRLQEPAYAGPALARTITAPAPARRGVPVVPTVPVAVVLPAKHHTGPASPERPTPGWVVWSAGGVTGLIVAAQLALFTGLPGIVQGALAAGVGGLVAVGYALEAPMAPASSRRPGPGQREVDLSAVGLFAALLVAAGILVGLLAWSPAPWWAALAGGTVAGPVLVGCSIAVRSLVEQVVRRGWLRSDLATTSGLINGCVAFLLLSTGGHVPAVGAVAGGMGVWPVVALAVAVLLPRRRRH